MATSPIYSWPEPDNTDLVKNGALAIRTLGNAIDTTMGTMVAKTVVDAKGDLIAGTAADTVNRLAVGNNGETLVADSSTSTGLRYQSNFAAGKNKIINGDFTINQRGFTSNTTSGAYNFDRFLQLNSGGTFTVTPQTFTPGTAPVAGYEGKNFVRGVTASQSASGDFAIITQYIEDVRTFANQTVTVSFWAKAASGTPSVTVETDQTFDSGSSELTTFGKVTLSTSWARYSVTGTLKSAAGKTIAASGSALKIYLWLSAGSSWNSRTSSLGIQNNTFDIWGVQIEAGSTATAFQTATGTIQGELAACQRYCQMYSPSAGNQDYLVFGGTVDSSAYARYPFVFPVVMRTAPTLTTTGTANNYANLNASGRQLATVVPTLETSRTFSASVTCTSGGLSTGQATSFRNGDGIGYLLFTAEL